jgi:hypothetical protein
VAVAAVQCRAPVGDAALARLYRPTITARKGTRGHDGRCDGTVACAPTRHWCYPLVAAHSGCAPASQGAGSCSHKRFIGWFSPSRS